MAALTDQLIKDTLGGLLTSLSYEWDDITVEKKDDALHVDIKCKEPSKLIGWHGETLNAVQHLLKSMLRTLLKTERAPFLLLDTDGYRLQQEDKVRAIAARKIDFVRRTGARVALPPMSPYFRRIVHTYVSSDPKLADCTTESTGEGDYRQVVLRLKDEKNRSAAHEEIGEELSPVMAHDEEEKNVFENLDV